MPSRSPLSRGTDVDMVTRQPVPEADLDRRRREKALHEQRLSRQQSLRIALLGEQSNVVLAQVGQELANRIEAMVQQDDECQALLRVIQHFEEQLAIGKRAAHALMSDLYQHL